MKTLDEIAASHGTDKSTQHAHPHGYTPHYAQFFEPLRDKPIKMLEIGVGGGESIKTWIEYFPHAAVFGVDIAHDTNPWNTAGERPDPRYGFAAGDQSSLVFWEQFTKDFGTNWDIIIDDGGHCTGQIIPTFNAIWPHIKRGGLYCIEDLGCAYNPIFVSEGFGDHIAFVTKLLHSCNRGEMGIESVHFTRELALIKRENYVP